MDIGIVLIQEPYLSPYSTNFPNVPQGYAAYHQLTMHHAYGAAIIAKVSLRPRLLTELSSNGLIGIELFPPGSRSMQIFSIYCRPNIEDLRGFLTPLFGHPTFQGDKAIIGMDSNAHSPLWNSSHLDEKGKDLEELIILKNLNVLNIPLSDLSWKPAGTSFIDLTLIGDRLLDVVTGWRYLDFNSLSDHPYIFFRIHHTLDRSILRQPSLLGLPSMADVDIQRLKRNLREALSPVQATYTTPQEIDASINQLTRTIRESVLNSRVCHPRGPRPRNLWWSASLCSLRSQLRKLTKSAGILGTPASILACSQLKCEYQRAIREAKSRSWKRFCTENLNNNPFLAVRKLMSSTTRRCNISSITCPDNSITTDPARMLSTLASAFFPLDQPTDEDEEEVITHVPTHSTPLTYEEITTSLYDMPSGKAPGNDGIRVEVLQSIYAEISQHIHAIYQACWNLCYFPSPWKTAVVAIIPKPGREDYTLPSSYRPISLLPTLGKLYEKVVNRRLQHLADVHSWFSPSQHGFVSGKSTISALNSFVDSIQQGFSLRAYTGCVLLDIQGAFDHACHANLVIALNNKGCPSNLVKLISSFLTNRSAVFHLHGVTLTIPVTKGCPQGSILSPLLWNVYVDDVFRISLPPGVRIYGFADDIAISKTDKNLFNLRLSLQAATNSILCWGDRQKLTFSENKTELIIFTRKHAKPSNFTIAMNGNLIRPVNSIKYLGLTLDSKLTWYQHVMQQCTAAKSKIILLRRLSRLNWGPSSKCLSRLYTAILEPMLLYAVYIWADALRYKWCQTKLRSVQRLMAISVTRCFRTVSTGTALVLANYIPMEMRALKLSVITALKHSCEYQYTPAPIRRLFLACSIKASELYIPVRSFLLSVPPWSRSFLNVNLSSTTVPSMLPATNNSWYIYTDGSKNGDRVSFAILITNVTGIIFQRQGRLPKESTIFDAETQGILSGLSDILPLTDRNADITVYSDSRSSLQALLSTRKVLPQTREIQKLAHSISANRTIRFVWIPAHNGIEGNEIVDRLACYASAYVPIPDEPIRFSWTAIKDRLDCHFQRQWEQEWQTTNNITRQFLPSITSAQIFHRVPLDACLSQIISGHSQLKSFLQRIGVTASGICDCGMEEENIPHFLFRCPKYHSQRVPLKNTSAKYCTAWPPPLRLYIQHPPMLHSLSKFLKQTQRLFFPIR